MTSPALDLTGKLLIAMPGMGDPRFAHTVIFMTSHTKEGAMGLVINRPADGMRFKDVMDQLSSDVGPSTPAMAVHLGGPVETGRGFVLHSDDYLSALNTLGVRGGFALTATLDILEDIAQGNGPKKAILAMGYSGWGVEQLEGELAQNGWLTADATPELVFDLPDTEKWSGALQSLGVDPLLLSADAGRA
ncbi:putative transcriptional regulator [Sulfitobacter noctilucae]|uniref:YqgE/AlgH family protein n=1 Tax=Sulfitobacter noctilucae TaxID=1342302 RepID=UPI000468E704|nr:YqgE/AlgH family protein [Sulfitobacter noctilucae]KIN70720.1 putative transcriptional regulator [Sulfitobacter noctilucae]